MYFSNPVALNIPLHASTGPVLCWCCQYPPSTGTWWYVMCSIVECLDCILHFSIFNVLIYPECISIANSTAYRIESKLHILGQCFVLHGQLIIFCLRFFHSALVIMLLIWHEMYCFVVSPECVFYIFAYHIRC